MSPQQQEFGRRHHRPTTKPDTKPAPRKATPFESPPRKRDVLGIIQRLFPVLHGAAVRAGQAALAHQQQQQRRPPPPPGAPVLSAFVHGVPVALLFGQGPTPATQGVSVEDSGSPNRPPPSAPRDPIRECQGAKKKLLEALANSNANPVTHPQHYGTLAEALLRRWNDYKDRCAGDPNELYDPWWGQPSADKLRKRVQDRLFASLDDLRKRNGEASGISVTKDSVEPVPRTRSLVPQLTQEQVAAQQQQQPQGPPGFPGGTPAPLGATPPTTPGGSPTGQPPPSGMGGMPMGGLPTPGAVQQQPGGPGAAPNTPPPQQPDTAQPAGPDAAVALSECVLSLTDYLNDKPEFVKSLERDLGKHLTTQEAARELCIYYSGQEYMQNSTTGTIEFTKSIVDRWYRRNGIVPNSQQYDDWYWEQVLAEEPWTYVPPKTLREARDQAAERVADAKAAVQAAARAFDAAASDPALNQEECYRRNVEPLQKEAKDLFQRALSSQLGSDLWNQWHQKLAEIRAATAQCFDAYREAVKRLNQRRLEVAEANDRLLHARRVQEAIARRIEQERLRAEGRLSIAEQRKLRAAREANQPVPEPELELPAEPPAPPLPPPKPPLSGEERRRQLIRPMVPVVPDPKYPNPGYVYDRLMQNCENKCWNDDVYGRVPKSIYPTWSDWFKECRRQCEISVRSDPLLLEEKRRHQEYWERVERERAEEPARMEEWRRKMAAQNAAESAAIKRREQQYERDLEEARQACRKLTQLELEASRLESRLVLNARWYGRLYTPFTSRAGLQDQLQRVKAQIAAQQQVTDEISKRTHINCADVSP